MEIVPRTPRAPPPVRRDKSYQAGGRLRLASRRELAGGMRDPLLLDPAIGAHLEAEFLYRLGDGRYQALQATLFAEMKGRIKEDDATVPP
jgi:oligopeptidase B